jgi:uncharacterized protein (DUF2237 family)
MGHGVLSLSHSYMSLWSACASIPALHVFRPLLLLLHCDCWQCCCSADWQQWQEAGEVPFLLVDATLPYNDTEASFMDF